jgi:hypothetical protein
LARIETTVLNLLMANTTISAIVEDRGFDREMRSDGWQNGTISVFNDDMVFQPTIMVTREDGLHPLGSPRNARRQIIVVWALSNSSTQGYDDVTALLALANAVLAGNDDVPPIPGVDLAWVGELGPYRADDGCVGRHDFSMSGIPLIGA